MFFYLSKIFWAIAMPLNFIWFLMAIGLIYAVFRKQSINKLLVFVISVFLLLGALPVGHNLVVLLERQYQRSDLMPKSVDGIIVLGGGFDSILTHQTGMMSANANINRLLDFIDLAQRYPKAKLVFSGGSGSVFFQGLSEADNAERFFKLINFDERPIIYERNSRNTYENVKNSKELVQPQLNEQWIVVTSATHLPRTMGIFKKQNWPVLAYPSSPKTDIKYKLLPREFNVGHNFFLLSSVLRETIGCVIYYLSGKSAFLLPFSALNSDES